MYYTGHLKLIKPNLLELGWDKITPNISTNHLILNTELSFDKTFIYNIQQESINTIICGITTDR